MDEHQVTCEIQARFYVDEPDLEPVIQNWMLLHGYGQLAQDFQKGFQICTSSGIRCIYPEGLSSFYSSLRRGIVGASWMTKENRKLHIKNSLQYLNLVIQASNEPEVLLGFSQGAEMASRLSMLAKAKALVLCGGRLAPELMNEESLEILHQKKIIKVQGLRDSIYSIAQHDKDCQDYHSKGLDLEVITFDGTHEIPKKVIADLIKKTRPCL